MGARGCNTAQTQENREDTGHVAEDYELSSLSCIFFFQEKSSSSFKSFSFSKTILILVIALFHRLKLRNKSGSHGSRVNEGPSSGKRS